MPSKKTKTRLDDAAQKTVRRYDKGERRYKHVGNSPKPEIQFFEDDPKRWIGKCPDTLTPADHLKMLNEAIPSDNGDREIGFPKSLFTVNEGAIYKADTTDRGKSYHGYPYRGKVGRELLSKLREMAVAKGCASEFDSWVGRHITVHGA